MRYVVIGLLSVLMGGAVFAIGLAGYHFWDTPEWYLWANVAAGAIVGVYFFFERLHAEREWDRG